MFGPNVKKKENKGDGYESIPDVDPHATGKASMAVAAEGSYPGLGTDQSAVLQNMDRAIAVSDLNFALPAVLPADLSLTTRSDAESFVRSMMVPTMVSVASGCTGYWLAYQSRYHSSCHFLAAAWPYINAVIVSCGTFSPLSRRCRDAVEPVMERTDKAQEFVKGKMTDITATVDKTIDAIQEQVGQVLEPLKPTMDRASSQAAPLKKIAPDIDIPDSSDIDEEFDEMQGKVGDKVEEAKNRIDLDRYVPEPLRSADSFHARIVLPALIVALALQVAAAALCVYISSPPRQGLYQPTPVPSATAAYSLPVLAPSSNRRYLRKSDGGREKAGEAAARYDAAVEKAATDDDDDDDDDLVLLFLRRRRRRRRRRSLVLPAADFRDAVAEKKLEETKLLRPQGRRAKKKKKKKATTTTEAAATMTTTAAAVIEEDEREMPSALEILTTTTMTAAQVDSEAAAQVDADATDDDDSSQQVDDTKEQIDAAKGDAAAQIGYTKQQVQDAADVKLEELTSQVIDQADAAKDQFEAAAQIDATTQQAQDAADAEDLKGQATDQIDATKEQFDAAKDDAAAQVDAAKSQAADETDAAKAQIDAAKDEAADQIDATKQQAQDEAIAQVNAAKSLASDQIDQSKDEAVAQINATKQQVQDAADAAKAAAEAKTDELKGQATDQIDAATQQAQDAADAARSKLDEYKTKAAAKADDLKAEADAAEAAARTKAAEYASQADVAKAQAEEQYELAEEEYRRLAKAIVVSVVTSYVLSALQLALLFLLTSPRVKAYVLNRIMDEMSDEADRKLREYGVTESVRDVMGTRMARVRSKLLRLFETIGKVQALLDKIPKLPDSLPDVPGLDEAAILDSAKEAVSSVKESAAGLLKSTGFGGKLGKFM